MTGYGFSGLLRACGLTLFLGLLPGVSAAAAPSHVQAELIAETTALLRGGETSLALRLTPEPGWHTYWVNPGDSGTATQLAWTLPRGVTASPIQWPAPQAIAASGLVNYGYAGSTLHLVAIAVPADAALNVPLSLKAHAKWLACKDICIPGEADLEMSLPVAESADLNAGTAAAFEAARDSLPVAAAGWRAHFAVAAERFSLSLTGAGLAGAKTAEFFPLARALVNYTAPQAVAFDGNRSLRLSQQTSADFVQSPARVEGVLVLTTAGGHRHAYAIAATPGPVLPVAAAAAPKAAAAPPAPQAIAPAAPGGGNAVTWPLALLFALIGGLSLNLMPCVFPVLSLKAYAVMGAYSASAQAHRTQALAYTAGAVLSCVAAAAVLLGLRAGGEALGWGFQLQSPAFVAAMIYVLLVLGLAMSGVLELGAGLMGAGSNLAARQGLAGSFFTGVLAVVVASPCTAPFMGSALGFAITQPVVVALSIFAALGLGLALPFLALGFFPALARRLPRPGPWMLTFKQAMAFPLYLTCAWLAWVLTRQAGADALGLLAVGMVAVALAAWLYGRPERGRVGLAIALLAVAAAAATLFSPFMRSMPLAAAAVAEEGREAWSAARLAELRAQHRTVFVNFTADWCITCKVNERGALKADAVLAAFKHSKTVWLTGDWTRADPAITAELARFGRNGVPLYLVYARGGEPQLLPQVLTPQTLVDALNR